MAVCNSFIPELNVVDAEIEDKRLESARIEYILNKLGKIGSNLLGELGIFGDLQALYTIKYDDVLISWIEGLAHILVMGLVRYY